MDKLSHAIIARGWNALNKAPIQGIVISPCDASIYNAHGIVTSPHPCDNGLSVGFRVTFDKNYPYVPPKIDVLGKLSHTNLKISPESGYWTLSLWDCIPGHSSWSCAFDLQACLLQMQSFLFDLEFFNRLDGDPFHMHIDPIDFITSRQQCDEDNVEDDGWSIVGAKSSKPKVEVAPLSSETTTTPFVHLPSEMIMEMFANLSAFDAAALYRTSKSISSVLSEDELWRMLLRRDFHTSTSPINDGFKMAYVKEMVNFRGEFVCYYTKKRFEDGAILGIPVTYTVNPMTRKVDYIMPDFQGLLSVEAFQAGVRQTPSRKQFDALIPIYIDEGHFKRAQPFLKSLTFGGASIVDALPTVLNTCIVLLADGGFDVSQRVLSVLSYVYRLFIALKKTDIDAKIRDFISKKEKRTKNAAPNLGHVMAMVAGSPSYTIGDIAPAIMDEMLVRNVLWMCKNDPTALKLLSSPERTPELLDIALKAQMKSFRILAYHTALSRSIFRPASMSIRDFAADMDLLCGLPGPGPARRFMAACKSIKSMSGTWDSALDACGLKRIPEAVILSKLKAAWNTSISHGYHTETTDFSKIHRSGVSKILLTGESYSADPGMHTISVVDHWKSKSLQFLDATLFAIDSSGGEVARCMDYSNMSMWIDGSMVAFHSGDVMHECGGQHTMTIHLKNLPRKVNALYIVASAWNDTLREVIQPFISVSDPVTGFELCQYHLDEKSSEEKSQRTAVVLCRIFRKGCAWEVKTIGEMCGGNARNYKEILEFIRGVEVHS